MTPRSSGIADVAGCVGASVVITVGTSAGRIVAGIIDGAIGETRSEAVVAIATADGVAGTPTGEVIPERPRRAGAIVGVGGSGLIRIRNRTGYVTSDLRRFFERGAKALRIRGSFEVDVVPSPIWSRGCAEVGGRRMVIAIASPSRFSLRRLARLFEHEASHLKGLDHERMNERLLYSLGPTPRWAVGSTFRYRRTR